MASWFFNKGVYKCAADTENTLFALIHKSVRPRAQAMAYGLITLNNRRNFDKEAQVSVLAAVAFTNNHAHDIGTHVHKDVDHDTLAVRFLTTLAVDCAIHKVFDPCDTNIVTSAEKSEIITAIDFESYTADNEKPYKHVMFANGSDGMRMRTNFVDDKQEETHQCGLVSGVFKTVSVSDEAFFTLLLQSFILKVSSEVHPHLICKTNEGSDIVCTWQMQTSNAPSRNYRP